MYPSLSCCCIDLDQSVGLVSALESAQCGQLFRIGEHFSSSGKDPGIPWNFSAAKCVRWQHCVSSPELWPINPDPHKSSMKLC